MNIFSFSILLFLEFQLAVIQISQGETSNHLVKAGSAAPISHCQDQDHLTCIGCAFRTQPPLLKSVLHCLTHLLLLLECS